MIFIVTALHLLDFGHAAAREEPSITRDVFWCYIERSLAVNKSKSNIELYQIGFEYIVSLNLTNNITSACLYFKVRLSSRLSEEHDFGQIEIFGDGLFLRLCERSFLGGWGF